MWRAPLERLGRLIALDGACVVGLNRILVHPLHAVAFAVVTSAYYPALGAGLAIFAVLTGVVRVVLALHYPSDVLGGMALGGGVALLSPAMAAP